ncbi:hypothetical protein [Lysobacter sp. Root494]|uniref:hypothetical protein n=1 Tax=Lysobacter sp. Root494 TaxID=1736549 RepID=UPI00070098D2|nr:hypothetical protein [Lysobacter sp. Root494]KQY54732.1 hypothetical protein ASD14_00610 [Lysobacter sp. Root494]
MQAINAMPEPANGGQHARRWQDVIALAQVGIAETLARAIAQGTLTRNCYQDWLAMESVACRIGALSLDAVAGWHVSQPALRATALAWALELREHAQFAARDVRVIDGMAGAPPPTMAQWHAFVCAAAASQRAGEALGSVLLHGHLFAGPMRAVTATILEMPFSRGGRYLAASLLRAAQPATAREEREALCNAYSTSALAVGAQRAAGWYRAALSVVTSTPETAP